MKMFTSTTTTPTITTNTNHREQPNKIQIAYAILIKPIQNSILELLHLLKENLKSISKAATSFIIAFALLSSLGYYHQTLWCLRWIGLGILSSVGFGFGMHTFVLFLAPHIAAVTLASQSCLSLDFPSPPYPKEIICPGQVAVGREVTFYDILQKVAIESFMWGLGTAIGELPPYLAARLRAQAISSVAGGDNLEKDYQPAGWELWMIKIIRKIGFIGILLCAAIPNPLFDAAGVASGIAQVPFLSFFGATFIGKSIIKVTLQSSFVIFLFHNNKLDWLVIQIEKSLAELLPFFGDLKIHRTVSEFLEEQKTNVLSKHVNESRHTSLTGSLFNWLIFSIMILFALSVIRALDKQYRARVASKKSRRRE